MITGDPAWVAAIVGASYLPMIFLQPIFGVFIERTSKKKVLIFSDLFGVGLKGVMGILYLTDSLNPVLLLIFTLLNASV